MYDIVVYLKNVKVDECFYLSKWHNNDFCEHCLHVIFKRCELKSNDATVAFIHYGME